ncbi:MAG TPA: DUF3016 domain-containing protein [Lysobacter sp.]|nr:DUF3016 domain-containing protein [Lysobacter sp.]
MKSPIAMTWAFALSLVFAGCATTPRVGSGPGQLAEEGAVQVAWRDPAGFREITHGQDRIDTLGGVWVRQLAQYLRDGAGRRLPPGERLQVTFIDIDRAGEYEPWLGPRYDDVRVMRDIYPPRIRLEFRRLDASGQVLAEGERQLVGSDYLSRSVLTRSDDPLRYEKQLLDDWLRRELKTP